MAVRVRGAIFDLDGTLVDTLPVCFVAFRRAVERLGGRTYSDDEIRALFGPSEEGMMQRAMPERWQEGLAAFLEEYERTLPMCPSPFPGIESVLKLLDERRISTAIVTGKGPVTAAMSIRHSGFESFFGQVETGSPAGVVKAEAITRLVGLWRAEPREVIYVGDAGSDILAARDSGVIAVGAAWASTAIPAELEVARPDMMFATTESFLEWVDSRSQEST